MSASTTELSFDKNFDAETGRLVPVADCVARITAPNAGPYTFTGTNSFLVGTERLAVLDPGPDDPRHFAALLAAIGGRVVDAILLTHTHKDHSALAPRLAQAVNAPIWFEGQHRLSRLRRFLEINPIANSCDWGLKPDRVLADGETFDVGELKLQALATPGHCANHLAFGLVGTDRVFSGDHIMGWNSTLVSAPDGSMADYLASLRKMISLPYRTYLPAHGGPIADGPAYAAALLAHREARNGQILAAIDQGARRPRQLLKAIYPALAVTLWPAALMTLKAHIEYLESQGALKVRRGLSGMVLARQG